MLRAAYGQNYDPLVELETQHDPGNLLAPPICRPPGPLSGRVG